MEEEIIETIEEETFDYSKLRYILKDGYVCHASLGASIICDLGECTEYNGDIPDGYETIVEWYDEEIDKLNAWKVVNGNLVFDEQKYEELQTKCKLEEELNSCASKKYVNDKLSKSTTIFDDNMCSISNDLHILNSNDAEIPEIIIEGTGDVKTNNDGYIEDARSVPVKSDFIYGMSIQEINSGKNLLPFIKKESETINGVTFTQVYNSNGSLAYVNIEGTATATTTYRYYGVDTITPQKTFDTPVKIGIGQTGSDTTFGMVVWGLNSSGGNIGKVIYDETYYEAGLQLAGIGLRVFSGATVDIKMYPMISLDGGEYEPYTNGTIPNPDFPSEIVNVEGVRNLWKPIETSQTINGITLTTHEDGSFDLSGTSTANANFTWFVPIEEVDVENGEYYCLHANQPLPSVNSRFEAFNGTSWLIALIGISGTTYSTSSQLTRPDKVTRYRYLIQVVSGRTVDYKNVKIQLEKGKIEHTQVPYGSNYLVQKICGKNLYNKDTITKNYQVTSSGSFTSNSVYDTTDFIDVEKNIVISFDGKTTNYNKMAVAEYDKDYNFITRQVNDDTTLLEQKFTLNSNTKHIRYSYRNDVGMSNFQIEVGDKATKKEEYKETLIIYDLQGNWLGENGDTKDNVEPISGALTKKLQERIFDGTEGWTYASNGSYFYLIMNDLKINAIVKSNYYTSIAFADGYNKRVDYGITGHNTYSRLCIRNKDITSVDDWKTYLQELNANGNPLKIQYELLEPQTIQLEPTEIILYEGINNIYTESNVDVEEVDITYAAQKTTFLDGLKVHISNDNILPIETINQSLNGLDMAINEDKSISLNGTTKNDTEFILNGSIDNIDPIFMLSKFNDFIVSGLTDDVKLNLYSNDGTNRELVYSGSNGDLRFDDSKIITCATLSVVSGKTLKIKIKPMITLDYIDYVEGKRNDLIDIPITELNHNEYLKIDRDYVKLCDSEDETELKVINTLKSFNPNTLIQLNDDRLKLATRYFTNQYINERLAKIEVEQDGITSKVSAMYDFTKEVKGNNSIILEDVQLNGLLKIVLKGNIIPPFPSENLFPSTNLYPVSTGLIFDTEEGTIRVNLPIDYLAELDGICDEFVWEMIYDNENKKYIPSTKIIRRIDLIDGVKTIRDEEEIIDLGLFEINIPEGTTKVYVEQYEEIEMFIRYSMINAVLAPYSTKAETETKIEQTATAITQEANAKIEGVDKELNAKLEVKVNTKDLISEINASADVINLTSDRLIIDSTNFKLDRTGLATMKDVYIDGGDISMKGQGESKVTIVDELVNYKTTLAGSSLKVQVGQEFNSTDYSFIEPGVVDICSDNYRMMMASATIYTFANNNRTISINGSSGDINAVGNITGANISSDRRLKENIKDSELNALNVINNIKVKSFDWKDKNKKHVEAGFIAQEVEKIDENFVIKAEVENKDNETIDYQYYINVLPIVATLTKAMQEQQKIIEDLQKEIKELKSSFLVKGDEE